jgi:hypothetical protein
LLLSKSIYICKSKLDQKKAGFWVLTIYHKDRGKDPSTVTLCSANCFFFVGSTCVRVDFCFAFESAFVWSPRKSRKTERKSKLFFFFYPEKEEVAVVGRIKRSGHWFLVYKQMEETNAFIFYGVEVPKSPAFL